MAWLDTSEETTSTPRSRMSANSACICGASGVVRVDGTATPSMRVPIEPITPVCRD
jgi:hypothetical protein